MRVIFAGTPEFAARSLRAIAAAGHDIALVLTQPDRPAGRGQQPAVSAVKRVAQALGIPIEQPTTLKDAAVQRRLAAVGADVMVVAAYGLILPATVLALPRLGCINVHASLLPRWRGAAPIQRAIEAGDSCTGVTIMQMDAGLDTGPMLLTRAIDITPGDTAGSVHDALAALGAQLIVEALNALEAGTLVATVQPPEGVTYATKIDKADAAIDWRLPAEAIERRVRAFNPVPGATAVLISQPSLVLKIWRARVVDAPAEPGGAGVVIDAGADRLVVRCGTQALSIDEMQRPGAKRLPIGQFLRGFPIAVGERFMLAARIAC